MPGSSPYSCLIRAVCWKCGRGPRLSHGRGDSQHRPLRPRGSSMVMGLSETGPVPGEGEVGTPVQRSSHQASVGPLCSAVSGGPDCAIIVIKRENMPTSPLPCRPLFIDSLLSSLCGSCQKLQIPSCRSWFLVFYHPTHRVCSGLHANLCSRGPHCCEVTRE